MLKQKSLEALSHRPRSFSRTPYSFLFSSPPPFFVFFFAAGQAPTILRAQGSPATRFFRALVLPPSTTLENPSRVVPTRLTFSRFRSPSFVTLARICHALPPPPSLSLSPLSIPLSSSRLRSSPHGLLYFLPWSPSSPLSHDLPPLILLPTSLRLALYPCHLYDSPPLNVPLSLSNRSVPLHPALAVLLSLSFSCECWSIPIDFLGPRTLPNMVFSSLHAFLRRKKGWWPVGPARRKSTRSVGR